MFPLINFKKIKDKFLQVKNSIVVTANLLIQRAREETKKTKQKLSDLIVFLKLRVREIFEISKNNVIKFYEKRSRPWLSDAIQHERRKVVKSSRFLKLFKIELYQPSIWSFLIILGAFSILFFLTHYFNEIQNFLVSIVSKKIPISTMEIGSFVKVEDNHYQNLIAVLAGIGGIVFALTIFIAESFRDGSDKGRVLLKESYIWPLTVSMILSFLLFLWGDHNYFAILPIIFVALLSLYSLASVITVLLNRNEFIKKRRQLLKELVQRSIKLAIDARLADNILLSKLDGKEINIEYRLFSLDRTENFICLKAPRFGRIKDINLLKLEQFSKILEREALKNNFSFESTQEKTQPVVGDDGLVYESNKQKLTQNTQRYLLRKYNDIVDEDHNILICYDRALIGNNTRVERKLEDLFKDIFKIGKKDSFDEEVRTELQNIRDDFSKAIKQEASGEVSEHSKTYIALAEGFLEEVIKFGGGYDSDQARKERTSLFSGWKEVQWLSSDLRDLLELAIATRNHDVISTVAFTPIAIARRAIEKHDHYIFQEFVKFAESLYFLANKIQDNESLKSYLIDRSWRYISELCNFYVEHQLDKDVLTLEQIKSYKDFSIHFLYVYQNLLKQSFDNGDTNSFTEFKREVSKLFDRTSRHNGFGRDTRHLEFELEHNAKTEDEKKLLQNRIDLAKAREELVTEIQSRKSQMLFGVSAFILDKLMRSPQDAQLRVFYEQAQNSLTNDIAELTKLFGECHSFEVEDFWNWDWWESRPDEGVHRIDVLQKLERLYAVKALQILATMNEDRIATLTIPPSRDLAFLVEGTRDLMNILNDIQANPVNWNHVVSANAISRVEAFKSLLERAKLEQEENERQQKIETPPSPEKITEFKDEVVTGFYEREQIISFFSHIKRFKKKFLKTPNSKDKSRLGINTVDDKAAFFKDWFVHYGDRGENYGENMASGLDYSVLAQIEERATVMNLDDLDAYLEKVQNVDDIILISTDAMLVRAFDEPQKFLPHWHHEAPKLDTKGVYGWYKFKNKLIPVLEIFDSNNVKHLFVINKNKFGTYVQDSPILKGEDVNKVKNIFYIDVTAFSDSPELLEEFLTTPPEWLVEIGNRDEQERHLLQRILIKIFMKYHIEWDKNLELFKIILRER